MASLGELKRDLRVAKKRLREAEDRLLQERRREQELSRAYGETELVRSSALPRSLQDKNGGL